MFGYIAINKAEMKFKDFDTYHAYYCGLCKCLKDLFGRRGQMTLTYDMTFLIILLTGLYEPEEQTTMVNCLAHPLEKHLSRSNIFTEYAADINLLLSYYKCKDDWDDDRKKKSYITCKLLKSRVDLIKKKYPEKAEFISSKLTELSSLEKKNSDNIDVMAGLFGDIMAECFIYRHDEWEGTLRKMGFFLGKFIYLMDAYEDVADNIKEGSYNPLKDAYQQQAPEEFAANCKSLLTLMMAECSREFEKLPILLHADILRNILYSGVWCKYTAVTRTRNQTEIKTKNGTKNVDINVDMNIDTGDKEYDRSL